MRKHTLDTKPHNTEASRVFDGMLKHLGRPPCHRISVKAQGKIKCVVLSKNAQQVCVCYIRAKVRSLAKGTHSVCASSLCLCVCDYVYVCAHATAGNTVSIVIYPPHCM